MGAQGLDSPVSSEAKANGTRTNQAAGSIIRMINSRITTMAMSPATFTQRGVPGYGEGSVVCRSGSGEGGENDFFIVIASAVLSLLRV
jgi:hypothetical protein